MTANEEQGKNTRRFISTKNLRVLGKGVSAIIYELSEDKILKAFTTHYTESVLLEEFRLTKAVYDAGIKTMKAYEVVETDEFLGCVYERLYAKDLVHCMREDKRRIEEYVRRFGEFVKNAHKIRLAKEEFKDAKDLMLAFSKDDETLEITKEEQEKLIAVVSSLPSCDNFSHGDCHVGNVMLKDGDLLFIDLGRATRGNPLIDFSSMFIQYRYTSYHNMTDAYGVSQNAIGFTMEERRLIWDTYMRSLSGIEDEKELAELERQINVIAAIRMLHVKFYNKRFLPQEVFKMFINDLTSYYDEGLQPFMKI